MKLEAHRRLADLTASAGMEYGKLVQKLLSIALLEAGASSLVERSTQGIDVEVELDGVVRAIEVKTSQDGALKLGKKDLDGLAAREAEGARACVAALGPRLVDDWVVARFHRGEWQPGQSLSITQLRPFRERELERVLVPAFADAVLAHASAALRGQRALDEVLRKYPAYRLA